MCAYHVVDPDDVHAFPLASDTPLVAAVRSADPARVDDALKTAGADINAVDKYGFTPLHLACKLQITEVAERLIDAPGIDLDAVTRRGFSAMMVATWKGEVKVVEKLLLAGAKFAVKDGGGRDAWALAHDWDHEEILELFERHGHVWGEQTRTKDPVGPRWRKWPDVEAADEKYQREQELAKQEKPTEYDAKIGERLR
jgi:ankyrin repeat protein